MATADAQVRTGHPASAAPRATWHRRANAVVIAYLALTLVAVVGRDALPMPRWLAVHLLLLGAVTNAIVIWSEHFAVALLRAPAPPRVHGVVRLVVLNSAVVLVLAGVSTTTSTVTAAGVALLLVVVLEQVLNLVRIGLRASQRRFSYTVQFYVAGGVALIVGVALGGRLSLGSRSDALRLEAAHIHANLLGWVALSVLGTLFTLWPTVLRTRMVEGVAGAARVCLGSCVVGLTALVAGLADGQRALTVAGLTAYAFGVSAALLPFVRTWRRRPPHDAACWALASGVGWLLVGVACDLVAAAGQPAMPEYVHRLDRLVPVLAVGFVAQTLLGALTFLLPVVLGRGPSGFRAVSGGLQRAWVVRAVLLNGGVAVVALDLPRPANMLGWAAVMVAAVAFLGLVARSLVVRPPGRVARR